MALTTTSVVTHKHSFYDRNLLERAVPHLVHAWFGQVRDIPLNASDTILFRRYDALSVATTALTEGVTPAGSTLAITDVSASVSEYGDFVTLTNRLLDQTLDPVVTAATDVQGEQAGQSLDQICRDVLVTGTTVQYASTATTRATVTSTMKISAAEVREAVRTLKINNARKLKEMISPSNGIDTIPVDSCFVAVVHPRTVYDLKGDTDFVPVEHYPSQAGVLPGEVGKLDEIRFVETTHGKVFTGLGSGGIDVYGTLIFGSDAYGVTRIAGKGLENITKQLGTGGTADPLNQRATVGWHAYFTSKILNENWILRLEHAVS